MHIVVARKSEIERRGMAVSDVNEREVRGKSKVSDRAERG
jgi:hypothetical protein